MSDSFRIGLERQTSGDLRGAAEAYRNALQAAPDDLRALVNLGVVLRLLGDAPGAAEVLRRAVEVDPGSPAAHLALGRACERQGELAEAEKAFRRAVALDPHDATLRGDLATLLLSLGRYAEAWPLYLERESPMLDRMRSTGVPEWRGEPLDGRRLLVWPEQGFGDQIMMARFLPKLGDVTLVCQPSLVRLLQPLASRVVPLEPQTRPGAYDLWTIPMSIPGRLGVTLDTLPGAPYLAGRGEGGGIGVVARGNARPDPARSLSDEAAAALLALPGARDLLPDATGARDFQDTADLIAGLDLVITIDTSIAHLAGAMGKPTWILLPAATADWRWLRDRTDSPWYPSARLFRQPRVGDWASVLQDVRQALESLTTPPNAFAAGARVHRDAGLG